MPSLYNNTDLSQSLLAEKIPLWSDRMVMEVGYIFEMAAFDPINNVMEVFLSLILGG